MKCHHIGTEIACHGTVFHHKRRCSAYFYRCGIMHKYAASSSHRYQLTVFKAYLGFAPGSNPYTTIVFRYNPAVFKDHIFAIQTILINMDSITRIIFLPFPAVSDQFRIHAVNFFLCWSNLLHFAVHSMYRQIGYLARCNCKGYLSVKCRIILKNTQIFADTNNLNILIHYLHSFYVRPWINKECISV